MKIVLGGNPESLVVVRRQGYQICCDMYVYVNKRTWRIFDADCPNQRTTILLLRLLLINFWYHIGFSLSSRKFEFIPIAKRSQLTSCKTVSTETNNVLCVVASLEKLPLPC